MDYSPFCWDCYLAVLLWNLLWRRTVVRKSRDLTQWNGIKLEKQSGSFELWWKELAWELEGLCYNPNAAANLLCDLRVSPTLTLFLALVSKIAINNHKRMSRWCFSVALSSLKCGIVCALSTTAYWDSTCRLHLGLSRPHLQQRQIVP